MREQDDFHKSIVSELKFFLKQSSSNIITGCFLIVWAASNYGVNSLIRWLDPTGIDLAVFYAFQIIFAATSLIPLIFYYYEDTRRGWIRLNQRLAEERNRIGRDGQEELVLAVEGIGGGGRGERRFLEANQLDVNEREDED